MRSGGVSLAFQHLHGMVYFLAGPGDLYQVQTRRKVGNIQPAAAGLVEPGPHDFSLQVYEADVELRSTGYLEVEQQEVCSRVGVQTDVLCIVDVDDAGGRKIYTRCVGTGTATHGCRNAVIGRIGRLVYRPRSTADGYAFAVPLVACGGAGYQFLSVGGNHR